MGAEGAGLLAAVLGQRPQLPQTRQQSAKQRDCSQLYMRAGVHRAAALLLVLGTAVQCAISSAHAPSPSPSSAQRSAAAERGGGRGGRDARHQWRGRRSHRGLKVVCNWYGAGYCKHADQCASRGSPCCNSQRILDLEEAWLAGADPPLVTCETVPRGCTATGTQTSPEDVECLLILDFEGGANDRPGEDEIIELPVTIVNLWTAKEEARFHRFVRPSSWGSLPPDGQGGLRTNARAKAVPFPTALAELELWLIGHNIMLGAAGGGRSFLWATCGDWDLKTLLPRQCGKSKVPIPTSMTQWCNLKVDLMLYRTARPHARKHARGNAGRSRCAV
jgi:inhibitor of KinA sporulation pathway (predicted exonuclease)